MADPTDDPIRRRWTEVDRLFELTLGLPEADRAAFLFERCGKDGALRDAVLSLLHSSDRARVGLVRPTLALIRSALESTNAEPG